MATHPNQKHLRSFKGFVGPDRRTKTELLSLPKEILSEILRLCVSHVDNQTYTYGCRSFRNEILARFCLVCTTFAEVVRPVMIEKVYFRTNRQVEAFTKLLAKEGERMGASVRHVGVYGISDKSDHEDVARLLDLVPDITSLAIGAVPVNASSVHGSLVRALTASSNLTSIVFLQHTKSDAIESDSLLRRVLSSTPSSLRKLEVVEFYYRHDITKLLQSSADGTRARHHITSLNVTLHNIDADRVGRILDLAGSLETLAISRWDEGHIKELFEAPEVWKKLRHLKLRYGEMTPGTGTQIIGMLPASLTYLSLDPIDFDLPSLAALKSALVHIAFPRYISTFGSKETVNQIDVVGSLKILEDPRFSKLERLEIPPEWIVAPFKMGMTKRGVAVAELVKNHNDDSRDRAVLTFASGG